MRLQLLLLVFGFSVVLGHVIEGKSSVSFGGRSSSSSSDSSSDESRGIRHSRRPVGGGRPTRPIQDSHEHHGGGNNVANRGCGRGWRRFDRPSGGWCIKVNDGVFSNAEAESKCQLEGGTLSGLQDTNEILYITSEAVRFWQSGSLWVGAKRSPPCQHALNSGSCNPRTAFMWTDGSTTGTAGFQWNHRQPDDHNAVTQQCILLLASRTPTVTDIWTWNANKLDDSPCTNPGGKEQRFVRGYVCGKRPNERRRK